MGCFSKSFSPEYFSPYLKTSKSGITRLTSAPADEDMIFQRTKDLRVRDKLFIETPVVNFFPLDLFFFITSRDFCDDI